MDVVVNVLGSLDHTLYRQLFTSLADKQ